MTLCILCSVKADKRTRSRKQKSFYDGIWLHPSSYSNSKYVIYRLKFTFGYKWLNSTNEIKVFVLGIFPTIAGQISACVVVHSISGIKI